MTCRCVSAAMKRSAARILVLSLLTAGLASCMFWSWRREVEES